MGLGKTAQLIGTVLADRIDEPTLVVCPTSVIGNWERELARFAPDLGVVVHHGSSRARTPRSLGAKRRRHDVFVTSYGLLARDIELLERTVWGRLVLDEAQQVKNPHTAQAKAVQRLRAGRRIAMTGTPVENRLSELWAVMQAVNPGLLGSLRSFSQRFAIPVERDGDDEAAARLQRLTGPFVLSTGTVEERIDAMITRKRELAGKVVAAGETWITELADDDLRDLLTYNPLGEEG